MPEKQQRRSLFTWYGWGCDILWGHGVITLSWDRPQGGLRAYWSPNGTPWHHAARRIFRSRLENPADCVCSECRS